MALEKLDEDITIDVEELKSKLMADKKMAGLKLTPMVKKEQSNYNEGNKKKKNDKNDKKDKKTDAKVEKKVEQPDEHQFDPDTKIVFDIQIRNAFSQLKIDTPVFNKEVEPAIGIVEKKKAELEELVKQKTEEIANIKKNAEQSVPSLAELKEKFKDAPLRDRDDTKGTHGHKDRRGTRGGRREKGDNNVQWHGARNEKHPKREGDEEKADAEDHDQQEDSFEAQVRRKDKERHVRKGPITEGDFPKL